MVSDIPGLEIAHRVGDPTDITAQDLPTPPKKSTSGSGHDLKNI